MSTTLRKSLILVASFLILGAGCSFSSQELPNQIIKDENGDLATFSDPDKNYTFNYPKGFKIERLVGEFYRNEEYPPMGIKISDPSTPYGTFEDVHINILDRNWFDYGRDIIDSQIVDLEKLQINTIDDLKRTQEFQDSESITVNGLLGLKKILNELVFVVVQNPSTPGSFIIFEVSERGGAYYNTTFTKSHDLLNQILSTFKFVN